MAKDYYQILGIDKNASPDEVKRAFRKLAHQYHPDKAGGDEAKFKEINEAYQVLGNQTKRQQYDQYGATFDQQGGFGGGMDWGDFMKYARGGAGNQNVNFDFGGMGDIFGDLFGFGRGARSSRTTGRDIQVDLTIDFNQAAFGVKKELSIMKLVKCSACHGNGAEPGTRITTCAHCQGQGVVTRVQQTFLGAIQTQGRCPECQGQGKFAEIKCKKCNGAGAVKEQTSITVDVPAGIESGQSLQLSGQGEAGELGARAGDLYVVVHVAPSPDFERQGADVYSKIYISFSQAALGDKVAVKTLTGAGKLAIPAGTLSGTFFKLRAQGVPRLNSHGRGDQLVEVIINVPKHLTRTQKKMLQQLQQENL